MGIKISAPELEYALAGGELYRAECEEDIEDLQDMIADNMSNFVEKYIDKSAEGVCVQASTLGSLEALLEFLKKMKISVCDVNIGPVNKKDVQKAQKWLLKDDETEIKREYATILAFDVKISKEAQEFADDKGVIIMGADIIYHLFDSFTKHIETCVNERKEAHAQTAVFPCIVNIVSGAVFNAKNPIVVGMNVKKGVLKIGTPLCVPDKEFLNIGRVTSMEINKKPVTVGRPEDGDIAVKIEGEANIMIGR